MTQPAGRAAGRGALAGATRAGTRRYCLTGWETLCLAQRNTGYSVDGCYAEYFLAEAAFATPVPAGIDPREAAPLTWRAR